MRPWSPRHSMAILMMCLIFTLLFVFANAMNGSVDPRKHQIDTILTIHHLSDDIMKLLFVRYITLSSQIQFYKTCHQYFILLRPFLDPESIVYVKERPVLRIWKLYMDWENAFLSKIDASEFKQILMLNDDIKKLSGFLFKRQRRKLKLSLLRKSFFWNEIGESRVQRLLHRGVDPELVAILIKLCPLKMLKYFPYASHSLNFVKYHAFNPRSAALVDLVFENQKIPILKIFELQCAKKQSYFPSSLSPLEMDQILRYSVVDTRYKDGGTAAFSTFMQSTSNYESFLALFPNWSIDLRFWIVERMLTFHVPIVKIRRVCSAITIEPARNLNQTTMPLLILACSKDDETFLLDIILRLEQNIQEPFWGKQLDQLVEELGYSDEFRAKVMSALRYM